MRRWLPCAALFLALPNAALAEGVLAGQPVRLRALVIEAEGARPSLSSRAAELVQGPGTELPSMRLLRASWGDDPWQIVDISVDVTGDSIVIDYANAGVTRYGDAYFSGYEILLPDLPQALIEAAALDTNERLEGMGDGDLMATEGGLRLNVAGRDVDPQSRIRIVFAVATLPAV